MHVMCENNKRYDCKKCKMDKENNIMHVNPNKNDARKDRLIKKLKTENFPVSIGQKESSQESKNT